MDKLEYLFVEPISLCNFSCIMCDATNIRSLPNVERGKRMLAPETFEIMLKEICEQHPIRYVEMQGLGEPLLHPDLEGLISVASKRGAYVEVTSNGSMLTSSRGDSLVESGLGGLIVSVDSADNEEMKRIRVGSNPERIKQQLSNFVKKHPSTFTSINSVLHDYSQNAISAMVVYAASAGVQVIQFLHLLDGTNEKGFARGRFGGRDLQEVGDAFAKAEEKARDLGIGILLPRLTAREPSCQLLEKSIAISYDGRVNPCCRLDRPEFAYRHKLPGSLPIILGERAEFIGQYLNNEFCGVCSRYLWNYGQLMEKVKLQGAAYTRKVKS